MTKIIGILNLTLDSFSDGGMYYDIESAKKHVSNMIRQGADIIDVGAESTRSGFTDVDENIQIKTLSPVIEYINSQYDIPISIDTRSSRVVREFKHGNIKYINDVSSGLHDPEMLDAVSESGCDFILTHMPKEHKEGLTKEYNDILIEIREYFTQRIQECVEAGISKDKIIIDPGIGFGKSGNDNITLLKNIEFLRNIHGNVCIGSSNKRYSSHLFRHVQTKEDLNIANLATFAASVFFDTSYLRVHDVELAKDTVLIIDKAKELE